MYFAYSGGTSSLNADDQNGICALYPGSGSDCTTTGCPSGQECVSGRCQTATGDGSVCSPCSSNAECTNGSCLRYPDGAGYCGARCTTSADCGGDTCARLSDGTSECVRIVGGTPSCAGSSTGCTSDSQCSSTERCNTSTRLCEPRSGGGGIGAACETGADCGSGVCFAGSCSQSCDWLNPASCPSGFYCSGEAIGSCSAGGICVPGSAGSRAIGEACTSATECASLHCASGVCSTPCIPGGAAGCATGFSCQLGAAPGCGSCQQSGGLGAPCDVNEDCTSRLCAEVNGEGVCTELCEAGSCPTGFGCLAAGPDVSVCVPESGRIGDECVTSDECLSGLCATEAGSGYCTRLCDDGASCPSGYACVDTDDPTISVCRPPAGGCGCSVPGRSDGAVGGLLLAGVVAGLALWRRRRRA
jgi:MYXO-CTERM domain-containing protein